MKTLKIFGFIVILGFGLGYLYLRKIGVYNGNRYNVEIAKPLDKKALKIYQGFFSINRENDFELFNLDNKIPFYDGRKRKRITTDHGENDFLLIYNDSLYYQFRYFKTNCRMIDNLDFNLYVLNDTLYLDMEIDGTNPLKFKRHFNEITDSIHLRTNVPVDSAGIIYNGLELINR